MYAITAQAKCTHMPLMQWPRMLPGRILAQGVSRILPMFCRPSIRRWAAAASLKG
jgi:hypothetical protein